MTSTWEKGRASVFLQVQKNSFLRLRSESGFQDAESESEIKHQHSDEGCRLVEGWED